MSDDESDDERVTFRVEPLLSDPVDVSYPAAEADEIADQLDRATTILVCTDCGDLAPVTGGLPASMPACKGCGQPLEGTTAVHRLDEDRAADYEALASELEDAGVPSKRARVVALRHLGRDRGVTLEQIAQVLDMGGRANVKHALDAYGEQYEEAERLLEVGPDPDDL